MNYDFEIKIVHYKKLIERKKALENELKNKNINYEFIENFDRKTLSNEELDKFTDDINDAYKANFLSHVECYKNLVNSKHKYVLVLEDDSYPKPSFYVKINKYLKQLPTEFDLFYISEGKTKFKIPLYKRIPFKKVYKKHNKYTNWGGHGATKFADGYFISNKCAQIMVDEFNKADYKVNTSIDWWKNEIIEKHNLNVFWGEPSLIYTNLYETSFTGIFGQGKIDTL